MKPNESIFLDNALESGLPYFTHDRYDERAIKQLKTPEHNESKTNDHAQDLFVDKVNSLRVKRNVAEKASSLAVSMRNFINQFLKTKPEDQVNYLTVFTEHRYWQIVGSFHRVIQDLYH